MKTQKISRRVASRMAPSNRSSQTHSPVTFCLILLTFIAACGGGTEKSNLFRIGLNAQLPEELSKFENGVNAKANITDVNGSIYSSIDAGKKEENLINFEVELFGDVPAGSLCVVDFEYPLDTPKNNQALVVARLTFPFEQCSNGAPINPAADNWDFSFDPDGDGITTISELNIGTDPLSVDSDSDGVNDSLDAFPLLAAESKDTDGDGGGDNSDVDADGDGFLNDEEYLRGTSPLNPDTDGDGASDKLDNCPLIANAGQEDKDGDGPGNECDDDADGDGLSLADETRFATDPQNPDTDGDGLGDATEIVFGTNPLLGDSDADSTSDKTDNCPPIKNTDQKDTDGDKIGDVCDDDADGDGVINATDNCTLISNPYQDDTDKDGRGNSCDDDIDGDGRPNSLDNCPHVSNPRQLAQDADADGVAAECDLDDTDAYVRGAHDAVFVDCVHGSDSKRGMADAPVATIRRAAELSKLRDNTIYAAACVYDVSNINFPAHTRIAGGFLNSDQAEQRFKLRDVLTTDPQYETVLIRNDVPTTILLGNDDIVIDGFHIKNEVAAQTQRDSQATIKIKSKSATIENSTIHGNSHAPRSAAIEVMGDSFKLDNNWIDGGGFNCIGCDSKGVYVQGAQNVVITNNTILGGGARFEKGIELVDSSAFVSNNRIETSGVSSSLGAAQAFVFSDSHAVLEDNYLSTDLAAEQCSIICLGGAPSESDKFMNNRLARFPGDDEAVIVRDCDGTGYRDADFIMGRAQVGGNIRTQER